jgi:hypothetical protein
MIRRHTVAANRLIARCLPKTAVLVLVSLLLPTLACRKPAPAPSVPQRLENPSLGFALADIATGCRPGINEGATLELLCDLDGVPGTMTFEVGEEERGVNLLEKAKARKDWFQAQPAGEFLGNRELVTPIGAAYTARGRYSDNGEAVEEAQVLTLHPDKRHAVLVRYRYPPGNAKVTQERMENQLLYVVGEMMALEASPPPAAPGSDAAEAEEASEEGSEGASEHPAGDA